MDHRREPLTPTLNRARRVLTLVPGAVLCREDDPPGQAYLVLSGSLRVYRRDRKNPQENEELAELGPGAIAGELSALLDQPRTATVQASTRTQVLALPMDQLRDMAQTHSSLLRVLILALKERAGLPAEKISELAQAHGVDLSEVRQFLEAREDEVEVIPAPPHDPALVDSRRATCPACGATFMALVFRAHMMRPTATETDFLQHFSTTVSPYDYEVWVCPVDLYASLQNDFLDLPGGYRDQVGAVVSRLVDTVWGGERPDFLSERNLSLRERSLELALELSRLREAPPVRLASVLHRLAWCARERGDADAEQRWLREALGAYEEGYARGTTDDPKEDLRLQYLCGELSRRLDDKPAAVKWFQGVLGHPRLKEFPMWERLARQQWSELRER